MTDLGHNAKFENQTFTIRRVFDAPRELVWKVFTQAKHMKKWFGPKGCSIPFCAVDLRPGGKSHYCMEFDGNEMWGKWTYLELKTPERLVAIVAFTDETGKEVYEHPGMPGWPKKILSIVTFDDLGDKTGISVTWKVYEGTAEEEEVFENGAPNMTQGWSGTFEKLAGYLAKIV